jgi:hypothetical protein
MASWWQALPIIHKWRNRLVMAVGGGAVCTAIAAFFVSPCAAKAVCLVVVITAVCSATVTVRESRLRHKQGLPRQIAGPQKAKFLSLLADVPTGTVSVRYESGDREPRSFAQQIVDALEELHWVVYGHEPTPQTRDTPHETEDLVFDVPPNDPPPACLQPLRDALSQIGFSSGQRRRSR